MTEAAAIMFAQTFKKDVTVKDMTPAKIGSGYEALHFKTPTPSPRVTWRQWALAEAGQVIVIVSAIKDANEKEVLPGVEDALKSFAMKDTAPVKTGK